MGGAVVSSAPHCCLSSELSFDLHCCPMHIKLYDRTLGVRLINMTKQSGADIFHPSNSLCGTPALGKRLEINRSSVSLFITVNNEPKHLLHCPLLAARTIVEPLSWVYAFTTLAWRDNGSIHPLSRVGGWSVWGGSAYGHGQVSITIT